MHLGSFDIKDTHVKNICTRGAYAMSICIKSICTKNAFSTWDAYIRSVYIESASAGNTFVIDAGTKIINLGNTYIGDIYVRNTCITGLCTKDFLVEDSFAGWVYIWTSYIWVVWLFYLKILVQSEVDLHVLGVLIALILLRVWKYIHFFFPVFILRMLVSKMFKSKILLLEIIALKIENIFIKNANTKSACSVGIVKNLRMHLQLS